MRIENQSSAWIVYLEMYCRMVVITKLYTLNMKRDSTKNHTPPKQSKETPLLPTDCVAFATINRN